MKVSSITQGNKGITMRIAFYFQDTSEISNIVLRERPELAFDIPSGTQPLVLEKVVSEVFDKIITDMPHLPRLFVASQIDDNQLTDSIIAAEEIHDWGNKPRCLHWLYKPLDHQMASAMQKLRPE